MDADALQAALADSGLRTVAAGTALLGATAGAVGAFAVLRRQSLQGDVVSHAALPGLAAAFLLGGREPAWLVLGAAVSGWLALVLVGVVGRRSRVPVDAALGGALAVFFGLGLVLMTYAQRHVGDYSRHPLDRYLFGQAAFLRDADLWVIGGLGAAALVLLAALWKEFKLLAFDPDYAAAVGFRVRLLDLLLTTLTVTAVVIGLKAVGVVLMTALLVAPAAAARQWSDRLGRVVLAAGLVGAVAGGGGTV
ncbi:MAG: metal ABC transporter permease, partial [Gemmataceae bacterium]|nr:metal ABC transporter permease [Gemmataceae bacterium]